MERLIPVVNRLQDVLNAVGADPLGLPQLAVVGSQSSGKSSVLEGLVGRDFLPRGTGIVTRRPLVLQLIHVPREESAGKQEAAGGADAPPMEWGEFLHKPNDMYTDFDEIRAEIERETEREAGGNKGISDRPINLKIYSPNVVNLTLVDLPGIAKVPVGDQPEDIEKRIRELIMSYIEKPDTLILTVSAANSDLANSDGLQLARSVDPKNERTIGVITKLDLMDKGTEQHGLDMLMGRVIPLKLGFVGVVNRSQHDIDKKKRIREAIRAEAQYFAQHPVFRAVSSRAGMPFLAKSLNRILVAHIRDTLPSLRQRVLRMLHDAENELAGYGEDISNENTRGAYVLQIMTRFAQLYCDAIDGRLGATVIPVLQHKTPGSVAAGKAADAPANMQTSMDDQFNNPLQQTSNELYGGARLHHVFNDIFAKRLSSVKPSSGLSPHLVRATMRNATGPRGTLFVPESAFEVLTRREVVRLEDPALQCVELAFNELQRIVTQMETRELLRFPRLREAIVGSAMSLLDGLRKPCRDHVTACIQVESSYINTGHPDFIGGDGAITQVLEAMQAERETAAAQGAPSSRPEVAPAPTPAPQTPQRPTQHPPSNQGGSGKAEATDRKAGSGAQQTASPANSGQQGFFNMFFGGRKGDDKNSQSSQKTSSSAPTHTQSDSAVSSNPLRVKQLTPEEQEARARAKAARQQRKMERAQAQAQAQAQSQDGSRWQADQAQHMPQSVNAALSTNATEKEEFETRLILCLISSYFDVVRKSVSDVIPKSVMHFLVAQSKARLQSHLVATLYRDDKFAELLSESTAVAERRIACRKMVDVLQRASRILNEVREFQV